MIEWKQRFLIPLTTPLLTFRLWSSENQIIVVGSKRERTKPELQCMGTCIVIRLFFHLCFWLRQSDLKQNVSSGVVSGVGRNGKVLILLTPILRASDFDFWFSLGNKQFYDSAVNTTPSRRQWKPAFRKQNKKNANTKTKIDKNKTKK